jgi:hypothetical protein
MLGLIDRYYEHPVAAKTLDDAFVVALCLFVITPDVLPGCYPQSCQVRENGRRQWVVVWRKGGNASRLLPSNL